MSPKTIGHYVPQHGLRRFDTAAWTPTTDRPGRTGQHAPGLVKKYSPLVTVPVHDPRPNPEATNRARDPR
jgi:hypothetical protein